MNSNLLIPLSEEGEHPPLFIIPAAGSTPLSMIRLGRALSPRRPVYSFIAAGMEDGREPHQSIEEMASAYLAEIRAVQDSGPYYLSGHCFGGAPAIEIASQLEAQGDATAVLALLESIAPPRKAYVNERDVSGRWDLSVFPAQIAKALTITNGQMIDQLSRLPARRAEHFTAITVHHLALGCAYRATPIGAPVFQLRSSRHAGLVFQEWNHLTTMGYTEKVVPGDTYSMLDPPYVEILGVELGKVLARYGLAER